MQVVRQLLECDFIHVIGSCVLDGLVDQVRVSGVDIVKNIFCEMVNNFNGP